MGAGSQTGREEGDFLSLATCATDDFDSVVQLGAIAILTEALFDDRLRERIQKELQPKTKEQWRDAGKVYTLRFLLGEELP